MAQRIHQAITAAVAEAAPDTADTLAQLRAMRDWKAGWDGYDALPPDPDAITRAVQWIQEMRHTAESTDRPWIAPYVTASANAEVVFEWWSGERKLTVYVAPGGAEYVKVWGPDIERQMADGEAETSERCRESWLWLTN